MPGIIETKKYYDRKIPYLYVRDVKNNSFIGTSEDIPSQLFRKTIASHIGLEEMYDWKKYPFNKNICETIETLSQYKENLTHFQSLSHYE